MKRHRVREWRNYIFENGSYKLVALFVTLILWVTILGRRDFVLSKEMDIEFLLPRNMTVISSDQKEIDRHVNVKVSGPRMALKRFAQNPGTITIDLGKSQPGPVQAVITPRSIEVPFGVKVLSVTPNVVSVTLAIGTGDDADGAIHRLPHATPSSLPNSTPLPNPTMVPVPPAAPSLEGK